MNPIAKLSDKLKIDLFLLIKLVVYSLLLINFAIYIKDDWVIAAHTMRNGGSILDWTAAYAVSIDESAWILLIFLFELETYVLSDEALTHTKAMLMLTVRIVCYISLGHTLYAYGVTAYDLSLATPIVDINNLCQLLGSEVSYTVNLVYTEVDLNNCKSLSTATQFFYTDPPEFLIVTDGEGLVIEKELIWVDIIEAITWLLILLTIEMAVWLQDHGIAKGLMIKTINMTKYFLYSLLWAAIIYWSYRGHWMFAWDEFVWIAGFVAIEMNVVEWRDEILEEDPKPR